MLSLQPDFAAQLCWLEGTFSGTGHEIIFFPKFHRELNFIERVWSVAKGRARRECDYSFEALYALLPVIMEEVDIESVRRMAQRCYRYMDCYRHGLSPLLANYAEENLPRVYPCWGGQCPSGCRAYQDAGCREGSGSSGREGCCRVGRCRRGCC